jgi:penicillin amidase
MSLLGCVLRVGLTALGRRRLPQIAGRLELAGLTSSVEVVRDRWGVPHIYASDERDAFMAQGFVHAQDRLWQSEMNRRTANGRLSEVVGAIALDTDRAVRTFGFARLGKADWENATPELRSVLEAYAAGINAFLRSRSSRMPVEFTLLGIKPEPWSPLDSLALSRLMIWQLSHAWYGEIIRSSLIDKVGAEHGADLEIHYPAGNPVALPRGIEFNRIDPHGGLHALSGPYLSRGKGSNSWTVSARKTASGGAYLCNDMHLPLSVPSLWYENHLIAGDLNVTGVSLPGMPLVLVGHNARVAWGITLAYTDCEDLFVEHLLSPESPSYSFCGEWRQAELVEERIRIKGKPDHIERVTITHHGPVLPDIVDHPAVRLAVNSMSLRPCPAIEGWHRLDRARNWDEFVEAMRRIEAPQLNIAFADIEGNTGYWMTGKVPVRAQGDGTVPALGASGDQEWIGEVPFEEMPHALNPEQGFLVTTNQRIVPDGYPHFLGNVWMNGYRARRISEVLGKSNRLTPEDFRELQMDCTCIPGIEFAQKVAGLKTQDADARLSLELLRAWDGVLGPDSVGGAVYEVARLAVVRNLFQPALGEDLTNRLLGKTFNPLLLPAHEFYGHDTVVMLRMLDDPASWWVAKAGGRQVLLERSLKQAAAWLRDSFGRDPSTWQWGRLHRAVLPHALGLQKPLDEVFNRGPLPIGGDTDTVLQTAHSAEDPYDNKLWSPSYRQIVDMADLTRSLVIHPPGQSGQLGSRHYDDLLLPWLRGEYHPMLWTREQVLLEAEGTLTLHA